MTFKIQSQFSFGRISLWGKYVFVRDFPYQFFQAVARRCSVKKGLRPATLLKKNSGTGVSL